MAVSSNMPRSAVLYISEGCFLFFTVFFAQFDIATKWKCILVNVGFSIHFLCGIKNLFQLKNPIPLSNKIRGELQYPWHFYFITISKAWNELLFLTGKSYTEGESTFRIAGVIGTTATRLQPVSSFKRTHRPTDKVMLKTLLILQCKTLKIPYTISQ